MHELSLRRVLANSRDRFFKGVRLRWEWLRVISLDEFCWPGFFPVGSQERTDCAEAMNEHLNGCGACALRGLVSDLLQDLGAIPLRVGLDQSQDLTADHRSLLVASLCGPFLGQRQ